MSYLNDPTGFWASARTAGALAWAAVLPAGTLIQQDMQVIRDDINAGIGWAPTTIRWKGALIACSLRQSSDSTVALETGGTNLGGAVALFFNKQAFAGPSPAQNDAFQLLVQGKWRSFTVTAGNGDFDSTDDGILVTAEPTEHQS